MRNDTLLKAYILNDPVLVTKASGEGTDYAFIANALNELAVPPFYIWRPLVTEAELRVAALAGATQIDALTAGKRDTLLWAIERDMNFTVANNRAAIDDLCGSQQVLKASLQAVQKRTATVAEKVLATGTGTEVSPAIGSWLGTIQIDEIGAILAS